MNNRQDGSLSADRNDSALAWRAAVRDATADYSDVEMRATLDVNIPNYVSAIVTTSEIVDSIASL